MIDDKTKQEAIENRKISKILQDKYGANRLLIGKSNGMIFFDLPDDPKIFAELIKKLMMSLVIRNLDEHIHALAEEMEKLMPSDNNLN